MEKDRRVRFVWDTDVDIDGFYGYSEPEQTQATEELRTNLADGTWVSLGVICERKCDMGGWHEVDSLWNVVVPVADSKGQDPVGDGPFYDLDRIDDPYLRQTAHDMEWGGDPEPDASAD